MRVHHALGVGLLVAVPALAQEKPPLTPLRDVDVTYRMVQPVAGGPPLAQRMRWLVASGKLRVDPPSPGLYMIVDYRARHMAVVKQQQHAVLDIDTAAPGLPGAPSGGAAFARQAAARVVGVDCTDWQTADAGGRPTVLCLTEDGVMLRASQDGQILLEATSVSYAPQDPAAFQPPADWPHIAAARP